MPLLTTFFAGCWPATVCLKMAVTLTIEAADRVGDVSLNPDLQIANFKRFGEYRGVESHNEGASVLPDIFPYY